MKGWNKVAQLAPLLMFSFYESEVGLRGIIDLQRAMLYVIWLQNIIWQVFSPTFLQINEYINSTRFTVADNERARCVSITRTHQEMRYRTRTF